MFKLGKMARIKFILNALTPNSNENEISLNIINTCSSIQVMGIKKVITEDKMS